MCGISAIVHFGPINKDRESWLEKCFIRLQKSVSYRGPDGEHKEKVQIEGGGIAFLGHSRLAITGVDKLTGLQPQKNQRGLWFLFNGEIYNAEKIAKKYGFEFDPKIHSDTAVLANCFDSAGQFDGMFAIVMLDPTAKKLELWRDPLGIKPLYYAKIGNTIAVSSSARALADCGLLEKTANLNAIKSYLSYGTNLGNESFFSKVYQSKPGFVLNFSVNDTNSNKINFEEKQFFNWPETKYLDLSLKSIEASFLENLNSSLTGHKKIALALSSGLDSGLLAKGSSILGKPLQCLTLDFYQSGVDSQSEANKAKILAKSLDLPWESLKISDYDLLPALEEFINFCDGPSLDGLNTFLISQFAKKNGYSVLISGLGADELFFGYRSTIQILKFLKDRSWKTRILKNFAAILPKSLAFKLNLDFYKKLNFDASPQEMVLACRSIKDSGYFETEPLNSEESESQLIKAELKSYTQPVLLRDSDAASMANGIELRVPFLNKSFVEFSCGLKPKTNKSILWDLAKSWNIEPLLEKRKLGFVPPIFSAIKNKKNLLIEELINQTRYPQNTFVDMGSKELWSWITLNSWIKHNFEDDKKHQIYSKLNDS